VMERSAEVATVVPWVAELLPEIGSVTPELTLAVLDNAAVRPAFTATTRWTVALAPFARSPRFHVTVPADSDPPLSAETNEVPPGNGSVSTVLVAVEGPLFVTTMVYVTWLPAVTGSGLSPLVTERSALGCTVVPALSLLFPLAGSEVVEDTDAVFVMLPVAVGVTTTVTLGVPPFATVPRGHVMTPAACEHEPCVGVAET
jgi:hypothetical protein